MITIVKRRQVLGELFLTRDSSIINLRNTDFLFANKESVIINLKHSTQHSELIANTTK